jgi:hypothetical protein
LLKQEQWEKKKVIVKQLKKDKKKAAAKEGSGTGTRTCHAHLTRFNHILKEDTADGNEEHKEGEQGAKTHLTKHEKQALFK